jgi:hypothetical protein
MPKRFSRVDLHKFLSQEPDAGDVLRNHAYSKVGMGGEVKGMSVAKRRELSLKRRTITDYRRSKLGGLHDRPVVPIAPPVNRTPDMEQNDSAADGIIGNRQKGGIRDKDQTNSKPVGPRHRFTEPPRRNFNKYS